MRTALIPQYKRVMRTASGALQTESIFFNLKTFGESVISANEPVANVIVARASPMMVRYWKCHPYASFLQIRIRQSREHRVWNKKVGKVHLVGEIY